VPRPKRVFDARTRGRDRSAAREFHCTLKKARHAAAPERKKGAEQHRHREAAQRPWRFRDTAGLARRWMA
jgi:hypothetical protein